ncbi:hypothetical protein SAMN04488542_10512 [Fontibacillus panacisegetis]|uniref:Uncharacterized protein n=1 Tax=Fontibacillus panacisegetis TaxID=670482 RepID=A0A1G7HRU3_9BACL|nr:hypothetical protein [Fontibacillus panacisegetis]SDF03180.1 hypothetical protein SAMN04488542_10512 [Fontibacillus panacisegetis]
MNILTDNYKLASLNNDEQAVTVIQEAEATINRITGNKITLIAYEKTENKGSK